MKELFIVLVFTREDEFDCILENALFESRLAAETAIDWAVRDDVAREWAYDYRIFTVRPDRAFAFASKQAATD